MATERAIISAYCMIEQEIRRKQDKDLAHQLYDLSEELLLQLPEDKRWEVRSRVPAKRWVVVREQGSTSPKTVIAIAKGTIDRDGGFLVGPDTWSGYYYDKGSHYDTAGDAQDSALAERDRRIKELQRQVECDTERLNKAVSTVVTYSPRIWEYGEWPEEDDD